jgi:hypothetical protein
MVMMILERVKDFILFARFVKMQTLVKAIYFVLLESSHPFSWTYEVRR